MSIARKIRSGRLGLEFDIKRVRRMRKIKIVLVNLINTSSLEFRTKSSHSRSNGAFPSALHDFHVNKSSEKVFFIVHKWWNISLDIWWLIYMREKGKKIVLPPPRVIRSLACWQSLCCALSNINDTTVCRPSQSKPSLISSHSYYPQSRCDDIIVVFWSAR